MAPEIYQGDAYNYKCDIWSLGIIFYELLYGITPWNSPKNSQADLVSNILKKPLKFPEIPEIREKTKDLLRKMLEINQDKRATYEEILEVLKRKKKKMRENDDNLRVSVNQNLELMNKYPLVENCYINKKKHKENDEKDEEKEEKEGKNDKNYEEKKGKNQGKYEKKHKEKEEKNEEKNEKKQEKPSIIEEKELFSTKNEEITKDLLINKNNMVLLAEDYCGFHLNIANFLRKVFDDFESNGKLRLFGIEGSSLAIYLLFLKKMEIIVIFLIKKIVENEKINEFFTKEFYETPEAKNAVLQKLCANFDDSLVNYKGIYEECGEFAEKKAFFNEDFENNDSFLKNYKKKFEGLLKIFSEKVQENDKKTMKLMVEISICKSLDDLFGFFKFEREKNNSDMFYRLYEDLKNPEKVKNFIKEKVGKC